MEDWEIEVDFETDRFLEEEAKTRKHTCPKCKSVCFGDTCPTCGSPTQEVEHYHDPDFDDYEKDLLGDEIEEQQPIPKNYLNDPKEWVEVEDESKDYRK